MKDFVQLYCNHIIFTVIFCLLRCTVTQTPDTSTELVVFREALDNDNNKIWIKPRDVTSVAQVKHPGSPKSFERCSNEEDGTDDCVFTVEDSDWQYIYAPNGRSIYIDGKTFPDVRNILQVPPLKGARNETALPKNQDCISKVVLAVMGVVMYVSGCGTTPTLLLTTLIVYLITKCFHEKTKKNTNFLESGIYRNLRREHLNGVLLNCIKEVSLAFVPDIRWKCLCRNTCNLIAPVVASYNGASYAFFLFEEKRELEECIGAKFSELKKTYHVSDIFGVQLDDLEGILSVEDLYIRHRISEEWQRSPSKIVVFLSDSDSPSITPNMDNNNIPIVASNEGVTEFFVSETGERNTVLWEPPVQEELVKPMQNENTSKGSPVLNGCSQLGPRSVEPRTSTRREDYQLKHLPSQNGELSTGKPRSGTCNDQMTVNPAVEDEEEVPCLSQEQSLS